MIFIDTSVVVAWNNERDQYHSRAQGMMQRYGDSKWFISDYIFDESTTFAMVKSGKEKALILGKSLLESELGILKVTDEIFNAAWKLFSQSGHLSFTDCTTIALMQQFHMRKIMTFDNEFKKQRGIEVLSE